MKNFLLVICTLFLTITAFAQNNRTIKGVVLTENDNPISGVIIKSSNDNIETTSLEDGSFLIRVSPYTQYLSVIKDGYIAKKVEIESSQLVIRLSVDRFYKDPKKKADEQAKLDAKKKAEEQAKLEAKKKAEEQAAQLEAKKKAEEQAKLEAKKKAEAQAQLEAKKKAEEQAKLEAKRKAEEQAKLEAKKKAEAQAQLEAKKKAEEQAERKRIAQAKAEKRKAEYSKQRKGYDGMVAISYTGGYNTLGISYVAGYSFNNQIFLGAGTGVDFNFNGGPSYRTITDKNHNPLSPSLISVPVFAYFKANFINKRISPYFAIAAGGRFSTSQTLHLDLCEVKYSNNSIFTNPQLGVNFRTTTDTSLSLAIGVQCYTAPVCKEFTSYNATINSAFIFSPNFHLGFTF